MSSKFKLEPLWLRCLPSFIQARVVGRPNLIKVISNIGWLFSDTVLRLCIGLVVGIWVARYLGPDQFGLLSYALALVSIFGAVATLGLKDIVVRELVREPNRAAEILGTGFGLRLVGGCVAIFLVCISVILLRADDTIAVFIVIVIGTTLLFQASEVVKYWFESQVLSKYGVWAQNGVLIFSASCKVTLILLEAPLIAFVWIYFLEAILLALAFFIMYEWTGGKLFKWTVKIDRARALFRDSWPLVLSAIAIVIYMRIDQIMLGEMLGNEAVGVYSAAVRLSELWYFIPSAIVASVFPSILEAKKLSEKLYLDRLQKLFDMMVFISLLVALPLTFLSDWIIEMLFGPSYSEAGPVLAIHIWAALFVFLGVTSSKWFVAENRQVLSLQRTVVGAIVNIGLNLFLIPMYGVKGAAYATVVSQAVAAFFADALHRETWPIFVMKLRAMNTFRFAKSIVS